MGAYRLTIYNTSLYFYVMNNLFHNDENATIHDKYDLKGSWVARNATLPRDGKLVTCRHCQQKYVFRRKNIQRSGRVSSQASDKSLQNSLKQVVRRMTGADSLEVFDHQNAVRPTDRYDFFRSK